jgi:sterol desaturase/sphingolipid hydroxylase (fatty acid hydroxylase superfamily)
LLDWILNHSINAVSSAAVAIGLPLPFFVLLGFLAKGRRRLWSDAVRALHESRINISIHVLDSLLVAPFLAALILLMRRYDLSIVPPGVWEGFSPVLIGFIAVAFGDFIGYWRHRLEHAQIFWPSHAIHHSDTEMTWLAIFRFHPINRITTTVVDSYFLLACGFPAYALVVNAIIRHYYGAFIHAHLPWTYGPLRFLFVSPAMHRWHHAEDPLAYQTNYATVFSIFDLVFGTFRVPGACNGVLGVRRDVGRGVAGKLAYPFRPSSYTSGRRDWAA